MSIDRKDRNLMKHSFQFRKAHHSAGLAILASREKDRKEKVGEQKVAEVVRAKLWLEALLGKKYFRYMIFVILKIDYISNGRSGWI